MSDSLTMNGPSTALKSALISAITTSSGGRVTLHGSQYGEFGMTMLGVPTLGRRVGIHLQDGRAKFRRYDYTEGVSSMPMEDSVVVPSSNIENLGRGLAAWLCGWTS